MLSLVLFIVLWQYLFSLGLGPSQLCWSRTYGCCLYFNCIMLVLFVGFLPFVVCELLFVVVLSSAHVCGI